MALSYNTNLTNVVSLYLEKLNVKVTRASLSKQLEENPYFPSLYSINNVLDKFHIPNEAFTLEAHHLGELQPPFITYINNTAAGKDFILVTAISETTVTYLSNNKKEKKVTRESFLTDWEKIVLVAEPDAQSTEPNYEVNLKKENSAIRKKQWLWFAGLTIAAITIAGLFINLNKPLFSFAAIVSLTKLSGSAIAILLLIYETDKSNSFVKNLCIAGKQTNCDAVLNSKSAGIAGLKWSEVGFFYFAASVLFLFYPSIAFTEKIPWLAIGATLVSPYILFSLYYQYKVVKQWCPLCLAVQGVLLLELIWAVVTYWQNPVWPAPDTVIITAIITSLLLPITAWFIIKPLLQKTKQAAQYKAAYKRLLYNPEHFNQLLQQQQQAPDGWQQLGITIGCPTAQNTILKVCNPYCGPCAKAHPELEAIIHGNNNINLKVIFTATNKENDRANKPVKHLLAIAANNNAAQTQQALDDWYNADKKEYAAFAAKYPMNGELKQQEEKVEAMDKWCREAGITATPTIYINGRTLPENYNISELKNIL
jgi:protein-disulfide isomerase/uncharacterized membrane protein